MATRLRAILVFLIPLGFAPIAVLAESCGEYPLSAEQLSYLDTQSLDIVVPDGEVPVIQRCDVDGNNVVDNDDLFIIRAHRGQAAVDPLDPMDWDGNGVIHGRDVGGCASACNSGGNKGCAVKENDAEEEDGLLAAAVLDTLESAAVSGACYQTDDFDGDGTDDFVGMFEYIGADTRGGGWTIEVVILTEDSSGNVQHIAFPYTGQQSTDTGAITQHLGFQPAGTVDLDPGSLTIERPGVVSYHNGKPKVIYYYVNGVLTQSFYGIDD